jgi:hypothetical protein
VVLSQHHLYGAGLWTGREGACAQYLARKHAVASVARLPLCCQLRLTS